MQPLFADKVDVMTRYAEESINGKTFGISMQSGRGEKYLNAFTQEIRALDIPVSLVGEERYSLCNTDFNYKMMKEG